MPDAHDQANQPPKAEPTLSFLVATTDAEPKETGGNHWYSHALHCMGDAVIVTNTEAKVVFINPIAERLTGWTQAEALGKDVGLIYQAIDEGNGEAIQRFLVEMAQGEDILVVKVNMELVAKDGSHISIGDSVAPIKNAVGETTGVVVVFRDTTEQRDARRKMEAFNLRLRQTVAETNHRVKNNLQVIAALVDLQDDAEDGSLTGEAREKLILHIRTLAHIHDFLTEEAKTSGDMTYISAYETLARLIPMVQATVSKRLINFVGKTVLLPISQSSSLALIVNELISNALKHGKGDVAVALNYENGTCCVEVLDDGPGFPEGFDIQSNAHNGLLLAASLTRSDLRGILTCNTRAEGGGRVALNFPATA